MSTAVSSISFDDFFADVWPRASFLTHDTQAGEDIAQVLAAMSQHWEVLERPDAYLHRRTRRR
jgi:hypothetical protein